MKALYVKLAAWTMAVLLLAGLGGSYRVPGLDISQNAAGVPSAETADSVLDPENSASQTTGTDKTEDVSSGPSSSPTTPQNSLTAGTQGQNGTTTSDTLGTLTGGSDSSSVPSGSGSTTGNVASSGKPSNAGEPTNGTSTGSTSRPTTVGSTTKPTTQTTTMPTVSVPAPTVPGKIVVGYYTGWSAYKGYTPAKVPAAYLSHLNYAFAKIDPKTKKIALADPAQDRKNFAAIRQLKQSHPHLKTLISVGGWDYSAYFSDVAASAAGREAFAQSCVAFILEHGFDGVDIDWEYPVSGGLAGNSNRPQDKQNFTLLLQAIRGKLDQQEKKDGRTYYLTIAGAANTSYLSKIEPQAVAGIVDYIFVMAYDMHGPWDRYADLNAPLYTPSEASPQYKNSVYDGILAYRNKGVPAKKLVLGMPFYGYLYQGVSNTNGGLYSRFTSAKAVSYDTVKNSYLGKAAYTQHRHSSAQVPYLSGGQIFLSYEDPVSIAAKASLAKSLGLGGIGAWELSHDTSNSLLKSAYKAL